MKKKSDRRDFLKKISIGGVGAAVMPQILIRPSQAEAKPARIKSAESKSEHAYNGSYYGDNLRRLAFPIGGMGAGMFCLEGTGAFSHMSIHHKPDIFNEPGIFAALSVQGMAGGAKVLEGPVPDWKIFGKPDSGNGSGGAIYGLPRFTRSEFKARFPFGEITLEDEDLNMWVGIRSWSPFIPTDPDNSSLPVGALEYTFINKGDKALQAGFSFNARNFLGMEDHPGSIKKIDRGFVLSQDGKPDKPALQADFAIFTDQDNTVVDYCWFRGGWFDPLTITWESLIRGEIKNTPPVDAGAPGATLYVPFSLSPGSRKSLRLMFAWYVPNSDIRIGDDVPGDKNCHPSEGCCNTTAELGYEKDNPDYDKGNYKPWYSSRFATIHEVASYWNEHYDDLLTKSKLFSKAFFDTSLPEEVVEAVSANLTILKSPTVMRQFDGRLWSYEGCGDNFGCCHGSCTHVWNYAQAIPHLFPSLERTLRSTEFCEDQNAEGHQTFRASLPIRPLKHDFYAAADGQLGGIMKVYREWRISGDTEWLKKLFPMVKVSLDYCIHTWDPRNKGVIEEPHHNTYDIEFWGPESLCTGFYMGALNAMIQMGSALGKDVSSYKKLYDKGRKFLETELFDGEYFFQKIEVSGLNAPNPAEASGKSIGGNYSPEARDLLQKEGPKYQYGHGCLSDGVLGAWIARMCGLDDPYDPGKILSHLLAVHKYNLKKNLSEHANPQRPAYAMGDEGGLLLCTWPKGGELSLPFVYSNEVWTGIEYQVAAHLMLMGRVNEGLEIVRTCRDRYDGRIRNPFNEYECGHWYARALSSYGMIQGMTGVRYDAVEKTLTVDSKIGDFRSFLSTDTGFGTVSLANGKPGLEVIYGKIPVEKVMVSGKPAVLG